MPLPLSNPARYFPLEKGIYEVAPGLRSLSHDFGNGEADRQVFQIDDQFSRYRANKDKCRAEDLSKYFLTTPDFTPAIANSVSHWMRERLLQEHPTVFTRPASRPDSVQSRLTGETSSRFGELCGQVQEDVAVLSPTAEGPRLTALHLMSPSHWSGAEKIGKSFFDIHGPVPGIEKMNRSADALVDAMIHKGPYVRFVWGFASDERLNHHPLPPPGVDPKTWNGRSFPPFTLRIERQVTFGLPEIQTAIFTIRVSFIDGEEIKRNETERRLLLQSLLSMSPASQKYKGIDRDFEAIRHWLEH